MSFRLLVALIATGTSALKVVEILVALKAAVTEEGGRPTKKENPKCGRPTFLSVADPHVRGNNVIHCEADSQVMEM